MEDASFDDSVASIQFTRLRPGARDILDGLVMQLERLAVAATALGARPLPDPMRARALAAAADCAHAVARILPDLSEECRVGWALAGAAATIEAIEACRADASFPVNLDLLLIGARVRIDALAREVLDAA